MRLTLHSDYALRVLIFAAVTSEKLVSTRQISESLGVSANHLAKVVNRLGHTGFLDIRRGRSGGFRLAREPKSIRIGDIIRATEPDFNIVECFDLKTNKCRIAPACGTTSIFRDAERAFLAVLDRKTLADVIGNPGSVSKYRSTLGIANNN